MQLPNRFPSQRIFCSFLFLFRLNQRKASHSTDSKYSELSNFFPEYRESSLMQTKSLFQVLLLFSLKFIFQLNCLSVLLPSLTKYIIYQLNSASWSIRSATWWGIRQHNKETSTETIAEIGRYSSRRDNHWGIGRKACQCWIEAESGFNCKMKKSTG